MIKSFIKRIPGFKSLNKIRKNLDFNKDKKFFLRNYMYAKPNKKEKIEYEMLLEIHKLEKGFAVTSDLRPFGADKIKRIINDIIQYENKHYGCSFSYNLSYSALVEYKRFYEKHNWIDREEYRIVEGFLRNRTIPPHIPVGAYEIRKKDFINDALIDYDKFITSRRSIRNFSSVALKKEDIEKAVKMAIKTPTACNRQMCKVYYINSKVGKETITNYAQGLGLFNLAGINYFVVTFDVNASYFIGERNQGWFNSGLFTMNFINALHSLGIGSCCVQFGNTYNEEVEFKSLLKIPTNERVGVIIGAGYYDEVSKIPYSSRKPIEEIYRER